MNYAIETGLRGLRRHPRTMILSIVTLALGLASVMTMLSLLAMLSADPLPGLSQHLYLGWVDSRKLDHIGDVRQDDQSSPPRLWKLADTEAIAAQPTRRYVSLRWLQRKSIWVAKTACNTHQLAAYSRAGQCCRCSACPCCTGATGPHRKNTSAHPLQFWTPSSARNY